ncbi:hypothetical protein Tco_1127357 [Tanacetum coccineum]
MTIVGFLTRDSPLTDRIYLSSTPSTLIVDDEKIPVLKRLKTDDSGVELTKEIMPADNTAPKPGTLENLLMWVRNRKYDSATFLCEVKIDKVMTKKVVYHVIRYRLELEIFDDTAEVVVVMFDETATSLLKCFVSSILDSEGQDEEEHSGLPPALANIVVIGEGVEESTSSGMVAANATSKTPVLKRLRKTPSVATLSKPGRIYYDRGEENGEAVVLDESGEQPECKTAGIQPQPEQTKSKA